VHREDPAAAVLRGEGGAWPAGQPARGLARQREATAAWTRTRAPRPMLARHGLDAGGSWLAPLAWLLPAQSARGQGAGSAGGCVMWCCWSEGHRGVPTEGDEE